MNIQNRHIKKLIRLHNSACRFLASADHQRSRPIDPRQLQRLNSLAVLARRSKIQIERELERRNAVAGALPRQILKAGRVRLNGLSRPLAYAPSGFIHVAAAA